MEKLLLTLAVGVVFIVVTHSVLRFLTSLSSLTSALITLLAICGTYIPLLVIDWPGVDIFAIQFAIYGITVYLLTILHNQAIEDNKPSIDGIVIKKKLHWAPLLIVGFFLVVVTVDSIFITIAQQGSDSLLRGLFIPKPKTGGEVTSYFPGIIEHNFHEKEDQYNQYQQRLDEQRKRSWELKYGWQAPPHAKKQAVFLLSLKDRQQQPITDAKVSGSFQRGNTSKQDQPVELKEIKPGVYSVDVILQYPGRWELLLKVTSPKGDYDLKATTEIAE